MASGSMETWKKIGTFLLGVGLLASYHFAEDENGSGGLKTTFDEIKRDLRKMGETVQSKVHEIMNGNNRPKRTGATSTNKKNSKSEITVAQSH